MSTSKNYLVIFKSLYTESKHLSLENLIVKRMRWAFFVLFSIAVNTFFSQNGIFSGWGYRQGLINHLSALSIKINTIKNLFCQALFDFLFLCGH